MKRVILSTMLIAAGVSLAALTGSGEDGTFRDGDRVLFMGDSITPCDGYPMLICDYYLTRFPDRAIEFEVVGVSGDGVRWCEQRMPDEVFARKPTVLSVMFGMNDVQHHHPDWQKGKDAAVQRSLRQQVVAEFISHQRKIVQRTYAELPNIRLYWLTPSPYNSFSEGAPYTPENHVGVNDALAEISDYVRHAAGANGYRVIDINAPMLSFLRQTNSCAALVKADRVHPNAAGHLYMAWQFLKQQNAPAEVSAIELDCKSGKFTRLKNVEVSDILVTECGSVSFVAKEAALPMPIAPELRTFAREAEIENGLNREMLTVRNLPSGRWSLSIDGEKVLEAPAEDFAMGVNLVSFDTPQRRQTETVRLANAKRFKELDYLLGRCRLARWALNRWSKINPDDLTAVRKFRDGLPDGKRQSWPWFSLDQYLENWERRGAIQAEIDRRHDEIRKMAVPVKHSYSFCKTGEK